MKKTFILTTLVLTTTIWVCEAKISLPSIFTDNMVLQRQSEVKMWGTATPRKKVKIVTSWDDRTYEMTAGIDGAWRTTIVTPAAGGPYTINISDGRAVELKNVLIGEVWLCSGQSNMEMRVADSRNAAGEIADAANHNRIRVLHIDNHTSPTPLDHATVRGGGWQVCGTETAGNFSATGYFFGKELLTSLDIPIGLITSSWGGTLAEAWTSAEALDDMPYFHPSLEKTKILPSSPAARTAMFHEDIDKWRRLMATTENGVESDTPLWVAPSFDDSTWGEISAPGFVQDHGLDNFSGFLWMRKTVEIPDGWVGRELTLGLAMIDDNDFTYFNGIEVGHSEGCFADRQYTVPADLVKSGRAVIAVRVMDTGGKGGIWGDAERMTLGPSVQERIPLAGMWRYKPAMNLDEAPAMPVDTASEPNFPTFLYNAMINPLVDYNIRGAIWYQGEANVSRAGQYADLLPLMIDDWRRQWGYSFPFYIVQLANFMKVQQGPEKSEWAELREAQQHALHLENTGLAVTIDIGEAEDIHPKNKQEVGRRLALVARARTYGEDVACSGPLYESYSIEDAAIRVSFSHVDAGLKTRDGGLLTGFYVAGVDRVFHKADAYIDGETVVVSSSGVRFPVAVRYGWANNPACNLYNEADLPTAPFRTDDWP